MCRCWKWLSGKKEKGTDVRGGVSGGVWLGSERLFWERKKRVQLCGVQKFRPGKGCGFGFLKEIGLGLGFLYFSQICKIVPPYEWVGNSYL